MTGLFGAALAIGALAGSLWPAAGTALGELVDPLIVLLVACVFFTLRFDGVAHLSRAPRTVLIVLGVNFVAVPALAFALTAVLVPDDALRLGVLIYCLFPCTDWFLGFTRLAGGDALIGSALVPVQMVLQLALYPVWLRLFAGQDVGPVFDAAGESLLVWFALPAGAALAARALLRILLPAPGGGRLVAAVDAATPAVIAGVILTLFAGNVEAVLAAPMAFLGVLGVVAAFFVATWLLGEGIARLFRMSPAEHALLAVSTSARNAPLMLAVTAIAIPDRPVVHAAIVLGMLVEFPHLTALTHLLRRRHDRPMAPGSEKQLQETDISCGARARVL
ncbi:symporter [Kocuria polaris]|nr:symporter [Kocuria polaris]